MSQSTLLFSDESTFLTPRNVFDVCGVLSFVHRVKFLTPDNTASDLLSVTMDTKTTADMRLLYIITWFVQAVNERANSTKGKRMQDSGIQNEFIMKPKTDSLVCHGLKTSMLLCNWLPAFAVCLL